MINVRDALQRHRNQATHRICTLPILVLMPHAGCNCRCGSCDLWKPSEAGSGLSMETLARNLARPQGMEGPPGGPVGRGGPAVPRTSGSCANL